MKVLIRCTRPSLCRKEFLNMKMISIQVKPYSCPHCAKAFARQSALQKHIMDHALENDCNYKDPIIDKIIRKDVHRNTHVEEKHWHCLDCGKSFTCKHSLQRHMDIHTGQGSYPCIVCNKRLTQKSHLQRHMLTHTGEKPYSCTLCSVSYRQNGDLRTHMRTHTGEMPYICSWCGRGFMRGDVLRKHIRIHTKEKPFACLQCNRVFMRQDVLRTHMRIHTGEKPYSCTLCGQSYGQSGDLQIHMRTHTGEMPYTCSWCGRGFTRGDGLSKHVRIHTKEKPFACLQCNRVFMRQDVLRKHMRIHTGEKPYLCYKCGKMYMYLCALDSHMRNHIEEKAYSCTQCDKTFTHPCSLKIHLRTHTGEKFYSRSKDNTAFKQLDHSQTHAGQICYSCLRCGKSFMQRSSLRRHTKAHPREKTSCPNGSTSTHIDRFAQSMLYVAVKDEPDCSTYEQLTFPSTSASMTSMIDYMSVKQEQTEGQLNYERLSSSESQSNVHDGFMKQEPNDDMICDPLYRGTVQDICVEHNSSGDTFSCMYEPPIVNIVQAFSRTQVKHEVDGATATQDMSGVCVKVEPTVDVHRNEQVTPTVSSQGSTSTHIDRFAQSMLYVAVKDEPDCSTYEQLTFPSTSASITSMIDYMSVKQEQTEGQLNYERLSSSESQSNVHDGFMKQEPNDDMICDPLYRGTVQDICVEHNSSGDTFSCMYEPPIVNIVQAFSRTQVKHEVDGATATQDMSGVCVKVEPTVDVHRNEQVTPTVSSQGSTSTHIDRFAQSMLYVAVKDEPDCSTYEQLTFPSTSASMTSMIDYMSVKQEQTEGQLNYERLSSSESQSNVHDGFMKQEPNDDMICDPLYRGTVQDICVEHNSSGDTFSCMYEPPIVNIVQAFSRTQVKHEVDGATATQDMSGVCVKVEPTVDVHRNEQVTPTVSSQGSTSTHIDRFAQSMLYVAVKDEPDCSTYEQLTFPSTSASMTSMIDYMSVKQEQTEGQLNYERLSSSESQSNVHDGFMKQEPNDDMICDPLYRGTVQDICVEHNSSGDTFSCMYEPPIVNIVQAFSRTQVKHEVDGATATQDMSGVCVKVEPTVDVHRNEQVTPTVSSQGSTSTHIDRFAQSMLYVAVKDEPDCGTYEQLTFPSTSASMISMIDDMSVKQEQTEGQLNYERLSSSESQSNVHDGFMKQEPNDDMICDPLYRGTVQDICVEHNSSGDTFSCMYEPPIVNIVQAFSRTQVKHEVDGAPATQDMSGVCVKVEPTVDVHRNEQVTPTVSSQGSTSTHIDRFAQSMLYVAVKDEPDCGTYEQLTFPSTSASMTSMIDYMSVKQEQTEGQLNYERLSSSESQSNVHDGFMKQEPNYDMICDPLYRGTVQDICVEHNSSGDTFSCMYEPPIVNIVQAFSRTQVKHEVDGATATQDMSGVCVKVEPTVDVHRNEQVTPTVSSQGSTSTHIDRSAQSMLYVAVKDEPDCGTYEQLTFPSTSASMTSMIDYMSVKQEQTEGQLNYERLSSSESQSNVHDGFMKQEPNDDMICDPLYRGTVQDICVEHNSSGDTFRCMYEPPIVNIVQELSRTQVKHEVDDTTATQDMSGVCVKVEPTVDVHRNEQVTPTDSSQATPVTGRTLILRKLPLTVKDIKPTCTEFRKLTCAISKGNRTVQILPPQSIAKQDLNA